MGGNRSKDRKAPTGKALKAALKAVMGFLDASGRPSAVIGGMAVIAHGHPRFTADIDATVGAAPSDLSELMALARRFSLLPRAADAESFARQNLVLLLQHVPSKIPVDLSLAMQPFEIEAAERSVVKEIEGQPVRVPDVSSMLVYKVLAGRPKDLEDADALLETKSSVDVARIESHLADFDSLLDTDRLSDFRALLARRRRR